MPSSAPSGRRRRHAWRAAALAVACGLVVAIGAIRGAANLDERRPPAPVRAITAWLPGSDTALPDDLALREDLERAIDLRERERFDRVLDAREPGELIEHATLAENVFERRAISIGRLFVVGDEFFAYPFRPENGWGHGTGADRNAPDYTPQLQRVHNGAAGGPDAFGCFSCHSKGGADGAGTQTQNGFLFGDGARTVGADQRNPPHLLGMGPIEVLGREMSAVLQAQAAEALAKARGGERVEQPLVAKGVSFGKIIGNPDGTLDRSRVQGVDRDLTVRPFGWKGHQATLRDMIEESLHIHQGLVSKRIHLAVRDGTLNGGPYGTGPWDDLDADGVSLEIDSGMLTTVVGYLAQLEAPVMRPPHDPGLLDAFAAGRARFESVGCASCHVPTLELDDPKLDVRQPAPPGDTATYIVDVAKDGDGPKIEPKYGGRTTTYLVHLFSDLKRHDMGADLASPAAQGAIPASVFLTRPLWDLVDTAPYLHDGRAPTIQDAIALHGGEAAAARDAYLALDEPGRASIRVYLASLSRAPKLFVP